MSKDRNTLDTLVLASCVGLALFGTACAPRGATSRTQLSSAEMSTSYVEASAESETGGASLQSLAFAERAIAADPSNAWAHYDRGVALHQLRRTDAAIAAYRAAEQRFGNAGQWGKSLAIYGRARALDDVGRCAEARAAYSEYAAFVRGFDPRAAEMATTYANECREAQTAIGDSSATTSNATTLLLAGNYYGALDTIDRAERATPNAKNVNPWLEYDRAIALAGVGRTDDAVRTYERLEERMAHSSASNARWIRSLAMYGRARTLGGARRCDEARQAYDQYATFVRPTNPKDADMALAIEKNCITP